MNRIVSIVLMQSAFVMGMSGCAKDESSRNDTIMGTPDGASTIANARDFKQASDAAVMAVANTKEATHDGKVVVITDNKLVIMDKDGQEHSHRVSNNTKATFDGNDCNVVDLKAGMTVRVTTTSDDPKMAAEVEAIEKHHLFANTHDGRVVGVTGNTLTMTNSNGQEHSYVVGARYHRDLRR